MHRRRPDLIVPIRDRRQHKRYLTLRNVRNAFLVLAVLFVAITIRSELQPRQSETFGRLFERELPKVEPKPVEVVTEASPAVADHTAPDPMLVAPAAREQWLHDDSSTTSAALQPVPIAITPRLGDANGTSARIAIVGGPEGVSVVREERKRQVLRGGFGR